LRRRPQGPGALLSAAGAIALVVFVCAACGGSGGGGRESKRTELRSYLAAMTREDARYERARTDTLATLGGINGTADATWTAAASALARSTGEYGRLATANDAIHPPDAIADEHKGFSESFHVLAGYVAGVRVALRAGDSTKLLRAVQRDDVVSRVGKLRAGWRDAVIEYAKSLDVTLPRWIARVGR
jgi:hypothetical protein